MTNYTADFENSKAFFIIGSNTLEQHPIIAYKVRKVVREKGAKLVIVDPREVPLAKIADMHLKIKPGSNIAILNGLMKVILDEDLWDKAYVQERTEGFDELKAMLDKVTPAWVEEITGVSWQQVQEAARMIAVNKPCALIYCMGITQHITGHQNVLSCANLQMLLGNVGVPGGGVNPLRGQNNVQGACDMGGLPNVFTGYQVVINADIRKKFEQAWGVEALPANVGLTVTEMVGGAGKKIKGLYVVGENPMVSDPDLNHVKDSLEKLDILVVQDMFLTETAQLADVVLPAASFAEKDGTFSNTERRVQRVRKAIDPPGQARSDWEIVCDLATRMGYPMHYAHPSDIMDEIASVTPSYAGISYDRLEKDGIQWPCPTKDHPGTKILHVGKFSRGLGKFSAVEYLPPSEQPDQEYPLIFTTGRSLFQYHTGTMTRRSAGINTLAPEATVEIHPEDANKYGIADGDKVKVSSRRGQVVAQASVGQKPLVGSPIPGVVFMTFHYAEASANFLTSPKVDPIAKIPEFKACAVKVEKFAV
ncbi:molybdopterin oxidoreductase [Candidatus Vecturithrix granuli]|uniref:Molybdopterin oxidoreductase n=1 Tax=Vecturithrix granuli TaxID=1499967 RepID=A0A081BYI6_VECG1|nr:molybdopterin oxidoreductase [Candidatus Vecturithrix granuli]